MLRAIPFTLITCLAAPPAAAAQTPATDLPVSVGRIREELAKPSESRLDLEMKLPVATFRVRVEQRRLVPTFEEWLEKELKLTGLQRQSADWAAQCCGGYRFAGGSYPVSLDPLFKSLANALERRKVRKIREQIARELAELEAARKRADARTSADRD